MLKATGFFMPQQLLFISHFQLIAQPFDNTGENPFLSILPPTNTVFGEGKKQEMFLVIVEVSE